MRAVLIDYEGREIRFPEERWQHIIRRHREMTLMPEVIGETLLAPDLVQLDPEDPDTVRLYCKWYYHTPIGGKWVIVVVKLLNGDAFVLTSLPTGRIKQSEVIWTRLNA